MTALVVKQSMSPERWSFPSCNQTFLSYFLQKDVQHRKRHSQFRSFVPDVRNAHRDIWPNFLELEKRLQCLYNAEKERV